jgi:hypothetical protein
MFRTLLLASLLVTTVAACGSRSAKPERYAVGTYLFTGSHLTGSSDCTYSAPPGVLDGSKILAPGTIKETCPSGHTATIIADYADHVALSFPKTAKVGEEVYFRFELRDAQNEQMTPTLSEMGDTRIDPSCTALTDLGRDGAQDTGRDPFMSAKASAPGTCKVSIAIELPAKSGGTTTLRADQLVTITN